MLRSLIIWSIAIILAVLSFFLAIGSITKSKLPEVAMSIPAVNGFAYSTAALRSMQKQIVAGDNIMPDKTDAKTAKLARLAFLSEPTSSEAVALIALGREGQSRQRLMQNAISMSKRNQLALSWMIMKSSSNDDVLGVLTYYDISMRTSPSSAELLLPIMASLLKYDHAVQPLAKIMRKNPPWLSGFWYNILMQKESMHNAAKLRVALIGSGLPASEFLDGPFLTSLVNNGFISDAETLYYSLKPSQAKNSIVRDGEFKVQPVYTPFDWELFSNGEYGAEVFDQSLNLSAISNAGGVFARQLLRLPKRKLNLRVELENTDDSAGTISLQITCAEATSKTLSPVSIPLRNGITKRTIDNSSGICRYYWLNVAGTPSDSGYDARIFSLSIT